MADSYPSSSGSKRLAGDRGYDMGRHYGDENGSFRPDAKRWRGGLDDSDSRSLDFQQQAHSQQRSEDFSHRRDGWHERNDGTDKYSRRGFGNDYYGRKNSEADYYGPPNDEGGRPIERNRDRQDWKCLECKTWNYDGEHRCARCGVLSPTARTEDYRSHSVAKDSRAEKSTMERREFRKGNGSDDGIDGGDDELVDEFGRIVRPKESRPFKLKREWPPSFDEEGSAFVFDSRCAMFYESESDFFYDPKSKLYYGNKQATYYHYNPESKSFEAVASKSDIAGPGSSIDPEPILNKSTSSSADDGTAIKSISIKIKTKVLKKVDKSVASKQSTSEVDEPVRKQHAIDIEKWAARTQELKASEPAIAASAKSSATATKPPTNIGLVSSNDAVPRTPKGEPICTLCRRKFPTLEKLKYHVDVSQLHKDNLAKQVSQSESVDANQTTCDSRPTEPSEPAKSGEYLDRALQRRILYGPDTSTFSVAAASSVPSRDAPTQLTTGTSMPPSLTASSQPEHDPLGAGNVGHQMFKKLGWTGGMALAGGKRSISESEQQRQEQMHANLQREWDRSMTGAPGHHH